MKFELSDQELVAAVSDLISNPIEAYKEYASLMDSEGVRRAINGILTAHGVRERLMPNGVLPKNAHSALLGAMVYLGYRIGRLAATKEITGI